MGTCPSPHQFEEVRVALAIAPWASSIDDHTGACSHSYCGFRCRSTAWRVCRRSPAHGPRSSRPRCSTTDRLIEQPPVGAQTAPHVSPRLTACSQSSSLCATQRDRRVELPPGTTSTSACTATRVFPAPVGNERMARPHTVRYQYSSSVGYFALEVVQRGQLGRSVHAKQSVASHLLKARILEWEAQLLDELPSRLPARPVAGSAVSLLFELPAKLAQQVDTVSGVSQTGQFIVVDLLRTGTDRIEQSGGQVTTNRLRRQKSGEAAQNVGQVSYFLEQLPPLLVRRAPEDALQSALRRAPVRSLGEPPQQLLVPERVAPVDLAVLAPEVAMLLSLAGSR